MDKGEEGCPGPTWGKNRMDFNTKFVHCCDIQCKIDG